jgi:hypothetical protein
VETPLKTLIDRFRAKPEWQHPDPAVRAEAVLRLHAHERETLLALLRDDPDARVRRAAVKKLHDVALLAERAREDADEGVREEADSQLSALAIHGQDAARAEAAVASMREARHLAAVAKAAALATVRQAAVARLSDPKLLAAVVRECEDNATRLSALAHIEDPALLLSLALKSDQRAVALAAVERLGDREGLEAAAARARVGAAARRARSRLDALAPSETTAAPPAVPPPSDMDESERRTYEQARAAHEEEAAERARRGQQREALCATVGLAEGEAIPGALERTRAAWAALEPFPGPEGEALVRRFEASAESAGQRYQAFLAGAARRAELEAVCAEAEALAGGDELAAARAGWGALETKWSERAAFPEAAGLRPRLEAAHDRLRAREAGAREDKARQEGENLARLTALGAQLERLAKAANPTLRDVDHTLREAKDALDNPGPLPTRRDRETVLARIEGGRKALYPIWQQIRQDTEWKRWANVSVQEELCARAEALLEMEDLEKAAEQIRDLDARWKQAKEAPKEKGEALWNRFKAARDQVKARCDAFFARQAQELAANLKRKEELCARAEALAESTDWLKTAEELKKLQGEWKEIGPVHRAQSEAIWRRFRRPCDRFFARRKENQGQREKEWSENLAKKGALCAQAEALQDSTDWEATTAEVKRLQDEWKTIGAVRKSKSEAIWQRFRKACDHFFERYKDRDNLERQAAAAAREALCLELEGLAPAEEAEGPNAPKGSGGADPPKDLAARVQAAQAAWRQAGEVSREQLEGLTGRFARARNRLIEAWPLTFQGTDLDPEANRRKAEKLCARVEELLAQVGPPAAVSGADLAERLKNALAANTIGGPAAVEAKWQSAATEVESAQAAWQRLGPVPGETGRTLLARFETASRRFEEVRPKGEAPKPAGAKPARPGGAGREPREPRPRRY